MLVTSSTVLPNTPEAMMTGNSDQPGAEQTRYRPQNLRLKSWKRQVTRYLTAISAAAAAVLLMRINAGAGLSEALEHLPTWKIVIIISVVPLALIFAEFIWAFFDELAHLVAEGGRGSAASVQRWAKALINVLFRLVDWLVGYLTLRSFDSRYRRRLCEDYETVNASGLGLMNALRLDLEHVYVDLQVAAASERKHLLDQPLSGRRPIWEFLRYARSGRGLALIGAPGSGKTTLLQHLLLVYASNKQGHFRQRRLLPIFIELRSIKNALAHPTPPTLPAAIRSYWTSHPRLKSLMALEPKGWLESRLKSGRVLFLLDGLDEVPDPVRKPISTWIDSHMADEASRNCVFILTSRRDGYLEAPLSEVTVLEVQHFTRDQTSLFIDRWYLANEIVASGGKKDDPVLRRATEGAAELRRRLHESPDLHALTVNPLLLTMVCMVHRFQGALPGSRSQLYEEICQVLLERWRQGRDIPDNLKAEQKLAVLRPLALRYMEMHVRELDERNVCSIIHEHLRSIGHQSQEEVVYGETFLRSIQSTSGLLVEKERGIWSFVHKTFQEYLAAEQWLRNLPRHNE